MQRSIDRDGFWRVIAVVDPDDLGDRLAVAVLSAVGIPSFFKPASFLDRYSRCESGDRIRLVETALYPPVKHFLEDRGFTVKGEIGGCDIVGVRAGEPPLLVICELKMTFNLEVILQAVDRAAACDEVWLAARFSRKGKGREGDARYRNLCRRLGFGMLGVTDAGHVEMLVSPPIGPPRKNTRKRARLLSEHARRRGDPTPGGLTRKTIMTAYRQRALECAADLASGPRPTRELRLLVPEATKILQANYYGWFERTARGVYDLTKTGRDALKRWPQAPRTVMEPTLGSSVSALELAEENAI